MNRRNFVIGAASLVVAPTFGSGSALASASRVTQSSRPSRTSTPEVREVIISVSDVNRHPDVLETVHSRITLPPESVWQTDPDLGPLSLSVEKGALTVLLGGGSARIEREENPLTFERIGPLIPGRAAVLGRGDRLVVIRGFDLQVSNDGNVMASALVSRQRNASSKGATS